MDPASRLFQVLFTTPGILESFLNYFLVNIFFIYIYINLLDHANNVSFRANFTIFLDDTLLHPLDL